MQIALNEKHYTAVMQIAFFPQIHILSVMHNPEYYMVDE